MTEIYYLNVALALFNTGKLPLSRLHVKMLTNDWAFSDGYALLRHSTHSQPYTDHPAFQSLPRTTSSSQRAPSSPPWSSTKVSNQPSWPSLRSSWVSDTEALAIVLLPLTIAPTLDRLLRHLCRYRHPADEQSRSRTAQQARSQVDDPAQSSSARGADLGKEWSYGSGRPWNGRSVCGLRRCCRSVEQALLTQFHRRGSFGTVGSIIRARSAKRLSMSSRGSQYRPRTQSDLESNTNVADTRANRLSTHGLEHLPRHQLYDAPVRPSVDLRNSQSIDEEEAVRTPLTGKDKLSLPASQDNTSKSPRMQSIKFGTEDVAHYYPTAGRGQAIHEQRAGRGPASQFQHRLPSQPEFDESKFSTPKVVTPPAQVTAYGSRGAGNSYMNPFSTPPTEHPLSQVDSRTSTLMTSLSNDQSIVSIASTTGPNRDSPDPFDSPPEAAFRPGRRYPTSRGSDDVDESQRLVTRGRGSPDSQDEVPAPGQIRLLPSFPK